MSPTKNFAAKLTFKVGIHRLKLVNPILKFHLIFKPYPNIIEFINLLACNIKLRLQIFGLRFVKIAFRLKLFYMQLQCRYFRFKCLFLGFKKRIMIA